MNLQKKKNYLLYFSFLFFILFAIVTFFVVTQRFHGLNNSVAQAATKFHTPFATAFFVVIAELGDWISYSVTCFLLIAIPKTRRTIGLPATFAVLVCAIANQILKFVFAVSRPADKLVAIGGYAYPSGHTMNGIVFLGILSFLIHRTCKNKTLKLFLHIFLWVLFVLICVSRIYLGVHHTSDVLGGLCIGSAILLLFIYVYNKNPDIFEDTKG